MPSKSFIVKIYLAALLLRLIPVILASGLGIGLDDMFQYDMLARSLASGNGFRWYAQADLNQFASFVDFDLDSVIEYDPVRGIPTSFRAPLYPAFLAIVYFFSGTGFSRFFAARLAQAILLGAPLAPLTYLVSNKLLAGNERASRLSAWIIAAYPMLLIYPLGLGTENPFFVLLLSSFLFLLDALRPPEKAAGRCERSETTLAPHASAGESKDRLQSNTLSLVLSGLFLGLTALTRSVILPFAALAFCLLIYTLRRRALLAVFAFLLVVTPWVIRNSLLHSRFTGIETSMGYNLYLGYYPEGNGSFIFGPSLDLIPILDDSLRDQIGTQKALEFIRAEPERILPLALNRLGFFFGLEKRVLMYFYSNNIIGFIPRPLLLTISAVLLLPFVLICIFAALGLSLLRWNTKTVLLALLFLAYLLPHVFILSEDRFHLALVPFIAILAAHFWVSRNSIPTYASGPRMMVVISVLIVFLLIFNWSIELSRDADKIAALLSPNGNHTSYPY